MGAQGQAHPGTQGRQTPNLLHRGRVHADAANHSSGRYLGTRRKGQPALTATISITDKGKTITYHAHHMRDVIEPVKQYGMFGEQLNAKKKLHTLTFYTED